MNESEDCTRRFFEHFGAEVTRIPEVPGERRADLRVEFPGEEFIVEVKGRERNAEFDRTLREEGEAKRSDLVGRTNPISRQIRDAIDQLRATPRADGALLLVALVAADDTLETGAAQFKATLYGLVDIVIPSEGGGAVAKPCLYFTYAEFYEAQDIDGAVLLLSTGGSLLCLNEFSPRRVAFRETRIWREHAAVGATFDPVERVRSMAAFAMPGDHPRGDRDEMLRRLKARYGLSIAYAVEFNSVTAAVAIPRQRAIPDAPAP